MELSLQEYISNISFEIKNTNDFFDPSKPMGLENPCESSASHVEGNESYSDFNFFKGIDWNSPSKSCALSIEGKSPSKSCALSIEGKSPSKSCALSIEGKSPSKLCALSVKDGELSIRQKLLKESCKRTLDNDLKNFKDLADIVHQNLVDAIQLQKEKKFKKFRDEIFEAVFPEESL